MKRARYIHYLALAIFVLLAYSKVAFFQHTLKWDMLDQFFPCRYFIGECLRNGYLPLWNPFEMCGYPYYTDPQGAAWYPIALLIGKIAGYSVYAIHFEFILTIYIGGLGMYHLVRSFSVPDRVALFGAIAYTACGFFVGNAEHLTWLISAAWIPCILWAYHRLVQTYKYGYALLCALFLYMALTGGYPGFFIVLFYLLLFLFIIAMISAKQNRILWLKTNVVFVGSFVLLASAPLLSYLQSLHYFSRGTALTLERASVYPFSPHCMLSFLVPFASFKWFEFYNTDVSMSNAYFGIIGFAFFVFALLMAKSKKLWLITLLSFLFLFISFGSILPFRRLLYYYVPLMDMFKYPALFRYFFIAGFILLACYALDRFQQDTERYRNPFRVVVALFIVLFTAIIMYERHKFGLGFNRNLFLHDLNKFIEQSKHYQHVIIQAFIQLGILLVLLFLLSFKRGRLASVRAILLLCAIDLIIATQLNSYGTIVSETAVKEVYDKTKDLPKGFPVPDNNRGISFNNDYAYSSLTPPLYHSLNIFEKQVGSDAYNNFKLSNYYKLYNGTLKDSVWANPYLYLSYSTTPLIDSNTKIASCSVAVVRTEIYNQLKTISFSPDSNDKTEVITFEPGIVSAKTSTAHPSILVLQQADFPGWSVRVDGAATPHFTSAFCNISIALPAGVHKIDYTFEPSLITQAAILSLLSFLGLIGSVLFFRKKLF